MQLGTTDLCKDEIEREVKFEFFRFNSSGRHRNLGALTMTLAELKEGTCEYSLTKTKGNLLLQNLKVEK